MRQNLRIKRSCKHSKVNCDHTWGECEMYELLALAISIHTISTKPHKRTFENLNKLLNLTPAQFIIDHA